jgi:NAD kinase
VTAFDRLIVVTRHTRLDDLIVRFNTRSQARFYLERAGNDWSEYEAEHDAYQEALSDLRRHLDIGLPRQFLDRSLAPTFDFRAHDLVVAVGQDGLVANVAKYATGLPLVAVNPDPERFDGILLPFTVRDAEAAVVTVLEERARVQRITFAEATLRDGQRLLAFNDLFIGTRGHVSARYRITAGGVRETQSSSGVLVSTGVGSTGWMSSVFNMARGVAGLTGGHSGAPIRLPWDADRLLYAVREPFESRHSRVGIVAGYVEREDQLLIESQMPSNGVIFSDGMEADFLAFDSGAVARIGVAPECAMLVMPQAAA